MPDPFSTGSSRLITDPIRPPDPIARRAAAERLDALAKPLGSLGRLEDLAAWIAACQGACPPRPLDRVRAVVLAGDHGVAAHGVSAYPQQVTAAMVRTFTHGRAAAALLARQHGVDLQIHDLAVDDELTGLPEPVGRYKIRRSSRPLHLEDALTSEEADRAYVAGTAIAAEQLEAGADLIIVGDLGIGNTTPAACLIAAALGAPAQLVTGTGTGLDPVALQQKTAIVDQALTRMGERARDPWQRLAGVGSADLAAGVAIMISAARAGVPILLDGLIAVAEAVTAEQIAPGVIEWCAAGHRSTEPGQRLACEKYGLVPILDAGMRLGEGSGALVALPVLRSAVSLLREMALLTDLA